MPNNSAFDELFGDRSIGSKAKVTYTNTPEPQEQTLEVSSEGGVFDDLFGKDQSPKSPGIKPVELPPVRPGFYERQVKPTVDAFRDPETLRTLGRGFLTIPETVVEGTVGAISYIPSLITEGAYLTWQDLTEPPPKSAEEAAWRKEKGAMAGAAVHEAARKMAYLGFAPEEISPETEQRLKVASWPFEMVEKPIDDIVEPLLVKIGTTPGTAKATGNFLKVLGYTLIPLKVKAMINKRTPPTTNIRVQTGKRRFTGKPEMHKTKVKMEDFSKAGEQARRQQAAETSQQRYTLLEEKFQAMEPTRRGLLTMEERAAKAIEESRRPELERFYEYMFEEVSAPIIEAKVGESYRTRGKRVDEPRILTEIWKDIEQHPGRQLTGADADRMVSNALDRLAGEFFRKDTEFAQWLKEREQLNVTERLIDTGYDPSFVDPMHRVHRPVSENPLVKSAGEGEIITTEVYRTRKEARQQRKSEMDALSQIETKPKEPSSPIREKLSEPPKETETPPEVLEQAKEAYSLDLLRQIVAEEVAQSGKKTPKPEEVNALNAAKEMERFLGEREKAWLEPEQSLLEKSYSSTETRGIADILQDVMDAKLLGDESGMVGERPIPKLSPAAKAARDRLLLDLEIFKRNAHKRGESISEYLVNTGRAEPDVAMAIERVATQTRVIKNPISEIKKDFQKKVEQEGTGIKTNEPPPAKSPADLASRVSKGFEAMDSMQQRSWDRMRKSPRVLMDIFRMAVDSRTPTARRELRQANDIHAWLAFSRFKLQTGASGYATVLFDAFRKDILGSLSPRTQKALDRYLFAVRLHAENMKRLADGREPYRAPKELTADVVREIAERPEMLAERYGLTSSEVRQVVTATDAIHEMFANILAKHYREGTISAKDYQNLKVYKYTPLEVLEMTSILENSVRAPSQRGVSESGIYEIGRGREKAIYELSIEKLVHDTLQRSEQTFFLNRAVKSLADFAKSVPGSDIAYIPKLISKAGKPPKYAEPRSGYMALDYLVDGVRQEVHVKKTVGSQLMARPDPLASVPFLNNALRIGEHLMGARLLRLTTTGALAPLFFLKGALLDLITISSFGLHTPIGQVKGKNLFGRYGALSAAPGVLRRAADVYRDVRHQTGWAKDFMERGGLSSYWTKEGELLGTTRYNRSKIGKGADAAADVLNRANKRGEMIARVAFYKEATLKFIEEFKQKHGRAPNEAEMNQIKDLAAYEALDYLNFSEGGLVTKLIDRFYPYTNVKVQTARAALKTLADDPKSFIATTATVATYAAIKSALNNEGDNKRKLKEIPRETRTANYIHFLGDLSYVDKVGVRRWAYVKQPKDEYQAIVSTAVEMLMAAARGDEIEYERLVDSLTGVVPLTQAALLLPPTMSAITGYKLNTNPFTGEPITHTGEFVDEEKNFKAYTKQIYVDLSAAVKTNPTKLEMAIKQLINRNNVFLAGIEKGYEELFSRLPEDARQSETLEYLTNPATKPFIGLTHPMFINERERERIEKEINQELGIRARMVDEVVQEYEYGAISKPAARRKLYKIFDNKKDKEYARSRFKDALKMKELGNERFTWLDIKYAKNNRERAKLLYLHMQKVGSYKAKQQARKLDILTPDLRKELREVEKESR